MCSAARMDSRLRGNDADTILPHTISFLCALGAQQRASQGDVSRRGP
jgi:hypothetical protein